MNMTLEEQLVHRLIDLNLYISCAESCTGGMLAARIVNVANASKVLKVSFVTYAEESKQTFCHVSASTLSEYGVVSEAVAGEMAKGVSDTSGAEVGVGITGIAGPGGGTKEIPVGTVCFGYFIQGKLITETMHFEHCSRNEVRAAATEHALRTLISHLH